MSQETRRHISELTLGQGIAFGGYFDPKTGFAKTPMQIKRMMVAWRRRSPRPKPSSDRMAVGE